MPVYFDYTSIVDRKHPAFLRDSADWLEWRYTYEGGRVFRNTYLKPFSDRETPADFQRRLAMSPIPAYAKREINKVKNSVFAKFVDIIRRGGSTLYQSAVSGTGSGVDGRGASMNAFLGSEALADILVMGQCGVLVDAPRISGPSQADVPEGWSPYLTVYPIEAMPILVPGDTGDPSEYKAAMLVDKFYSSNFGTGEYNVKTRYRWYFVNPDTGLVEIQMLDKVPTESTNGGTSLVVKPDGDSIKTKLKRIPLYVFNIGDSLIKDACSYQRALLNLTSSDTAYGTEANFPFLTRQRKTAEEGSHLEGENKSQAVGVKKGMSYEHGTERPGFINPSAEPLKLSIELRRELKAEVRELISGQLEDLGAEGTVASGLAFIGLQLEKGENRLADDWAAFENEAERNTAIVKYPECWDQTDPKLRIEEATALAETMYKVPGKVVKKEIAKLVADKLLRGRVATGKMDEIFKEIDEAEFCTSDPEIILQAKKEGLLSCETGTVALGFPKEEAEKAKKDQADRAAEIVKAQADAGGGGFGGAGRGAPDLSKDPNSPAKAREGESDPTAKLGGDNKPGVRGAGKPY